MDRNVALRMRDVALSLYSFRSNKFLTKIQLQKIIYLLDSIYYIINAFETSMGHETYFFGPYDKNIQNAVDLLVFRGYCEMQNYKSYPDGHSSCEYVITKNGNVMVEDMVNIDSQIMTRHMVLQSLFTSLHNRNLFYKIVELVYAEPIFTKNQKNGHGVKLRFQDLEDNSSYIFFLLVLDTFSIDKRVNYIESICDLYIDYLNQRRIALKTNLVEEYFAE